MRGEIIEMQIDDEWDTGICAQPIEKNTVGKTVSKINEYVRRVLNILIKDQV